MKDFYVTIAGRLGSVFGFEVQPRGWSIEAGFAVAMLFMAVANIMYTTVFMGGILLADFIGRGNDFELISYFAYGAIGLKTIVNIFGAIGFALLYPTTSLAKKWFAGLLAAAAIGWDGVHVRDLPYKVLIIGAFILTLTTPDVFLLMLNGDWMVILYALLLVVPILAVVFGVLYILGYVLAFLFRKGHARPTIECPETL